MIDNVKRMCLSDRKTATSIFHAYTPYIEEVETATKSKSHTYLIIRLGD